MIRQEDWTEAVGRETRLLERVRAAFFDCDSLYEPCCGDGRRLLQVRRDANVPIDGCDLFTGPLLIYCGGYVTKKDAADAAGDFANKDGILWFDGLEHLERAVAERLLRASITAARKAVVVFCPRGSFHPGGDPPGHAHLSTWEPEDFEALCATAVDVLINYHMPGADDNPLPWRGDAILATWRKAP